MEHPLLYTSEMAKAVLDGRKTQTRRVPIERYRNWKVGDTIWVREGFQICTRYYGSREVVGRYIADNMAFRLTLTRKENDLLEARKYPRRNTSGRFMYKSLARIFLEITNIRVEEIQDIDAVEAEAEGIRRPKRLCPDRHDEYILERFQRLWDSINAKRHNGIYAWPENPVVKVIEFKRIKDGTNRTRSDIEN